MTDYLPIILIIGTVLSIGAICAFAEPIYDWIKQRLKS